LLNEHIFFASSLAEVIKQLMIYRPTGVLTLWPAGGTRQEDTRITIEHGRLLHVSWGSHQENANESVLGWINSWGAIHFSFLSTEFRLQLPAPSQTAQQEQPPPPHTPMRPVAPGRRPAVTQPLQSLPAAARSAKNLVVKAEYQQAERSNGNGAASSGSLPAITHETLIISLTPYGKSYPAANLPRYDRTIFLLINGRRTVVNLSLLTRRPLEEIYNSLYRLRNSQLITFEVQTK
jgi:hypothetical protein